MLCYNWKPKRKPGDEEHEGDAPWHCLMCGVHLCEDCTWTCEDCGCKVCKRWPCSARNIEPDDAWGPLCQECLCVPSVLLGREDYRLVGYHVSKDC